jgi:hypothetical protein
MKTTSFVIFEKATKSFGTSILPRESIQPYFTPAVNPANKIIIFFFTKDSAY